MRTCVALALAVAVGILHGASLRAAETRPTAEAAVTAAEGSQAVREDSALPKLEVLQRFSVPTTEGHAITDVRWAGKSSIYLAFLRGLAEVRLADGLPRIRPVLPPTLEARHRLGPLLHLAASGDRMLVTDAGMTFLWGDPREGQPRGASQSAVAHAAFHDVDMRDDTVVVYGVADADAYSESHGGILWRSSYSKGLAEWHVLYESKEVEARYGVLGDLMGPARGAVRFQRDGSLVWAPNALPGVFLFTATGKLKKVWRPAELWGERQEPWTEGRVEAESFARFLDTRRVIDDVLALPEGPAILVREPTGPVRWRLGVLGPEIQWYAVPTRDLSPLASLKGDVDEKGRIVLVGAPRELYDEASFSETYVLVARIP